MIKKILILFFLLFLTGCSNSNRLNDTVSSSLSESSALSTSSDSSQTDKIRQKSLEGYDADMIQFTAGKNPSLYFANIRFIDEFSEKNEGSVSINNKDSTISINMTKATGTVTGAVDGPKVSFRVNIKTNKMISKEFLPAPEYTSSELTSNSNEVLSISDERLIEIANELKAIIDKAMVA